MQRWVIKKSICDGEVGNLKAAAQRFSSTVKLLSEAPVSDRRSWTMPLQDQPSSMVFQ